eukprot:10288318-Lingulodinium_polyedra.AAC.1
MASPSKRGRIILIKTGSGAAGLKSNCTATWVARPRSHRNSATIDHFLARRLAIARSIRDGTPDVG